MRNIRAGSIIFNKVTKMFDDGSGEDVHEMSAAYVYESHEEAQRELINNFDNPDNFEIWDIEIEYRTT